MLTKKLTLKRIFILKQDRLLGMRLQRLLEFNGYSVLRPISLIDTETLIRKDTPDLIIADITIRHQTCFDRVEKILGRKHLPVICIASTKEQHQIKECQGINIIGTFIKPFNNKKMISLLRNYFAAAP